MFLCVLDEVSGPLGLRDGLQFHFDDVDRLETVDVGEFFFANEGCESCKELIQYYSMGNA